MKFNRLMALGLAATLGLAACGDDDDPVAVVDVPNPPTVSLSVTGQTITATWSAVSGADSYTATLTAPGETAQNQTVTTTEAVFSGLTPSTTYQVAVVATNSAGSSAAGTALIQTEAEPETVVQVTTDILSDVTWTADRTYVLNQPVFVGVDCGPDPAAPLAGCVEATLTIEPGTTIVGKTDVPQGVRGAYLVVNRGSRLVADATGADRAPTEAETIVFTSNNPLGQRASADWGGLIVNGRAPTNAGAEATGEGDSGLYGGVDVDDDSGILRGVRIEFAGDDVTATDQLNGLALQGVGAGTTVSYVQIHYNEDDGIEPFGGTVSVDHLVVTGIGDDSVDGTDGYRGFMQFIVGQHRGLNADNGFEISNNGDQPDATPKSTAVIANATMIGAGQNVVTGDIAGAESDNGIQFREGSNYRIYNSIITGFGEGGFCIRDAQTITNAQNRLNGDTDPATTLSAEGLILWNNQVADDGADNFAACGGGSTLQFNTDFFNEAGFNNTLADPGFAASAFNAGSQSSPPDFTLTAMPAGYTAATVPTTFDTNLIEPGDGRTLVDTDYAGAIEPGTALADAWYNGWTIWSTDGSDSRPNADGN